MTPKPNPWTSLVRISVRNQVSDGNSYSGEPVVGAKTAPTAISRTFTPLLRETRFPSVRIHFSHSEADGISADVGGEGRMGILNFHFWGTPRCRTHTVEHRENAKILHLMCHQVLEDPNLLKSRSLDSSCPFS